MRSEKQEKLEQLSRILQSRTFHGSANLKTFLTFIVHAALDDPSCELKEYTIANEVFRNSKYDSRIDSTVRVQAGRLRTKLQEYYANGGADDKWIIELPKGHYIPIFRTRDQPPVDEPKEPEAAEVISSMRPVEEPMPVPVPPTRRRLNQLALVLGVVCVTAAALALHYRSQLISFQSPLVPLYFSQGDVDTLSVLWKSFLERGRPVIIVYSSTFIQGGASEEFGYLPPVGFAPAENRSPDHPVGRPGGSEGGQQMETLIPEHYTGAGEVMGIASLSRLFTRVGKGFRVKRAAFLAWDDVKTENLVILGLPRERDLLSRLPSRQTFAFRFDSEKSAVSIVNLHPQPGEPRIYSPKFQSNGVLEDFAVVSLMHGLGENNHLLTLAGTTTFGTQAAAEYVTNPASVRDFANHLKAATGRAPDSFEAILKVSVTDGVPVETSYLTHHPINP